MARIWMEGFEDGIPHGHYLEGSPGSNQIDGLAFTTYPSNTSNTAKMYKGNGRNVYSQGSLAIDASTTVATVVKTLTAALGELYFRIYVKHTKTLSGTNYDIQECVWFTDGAGNKVFSLYNENVTGADDWAFYAKTGGAYSKVADLTFAGDTWIKLDVYFKVDAAVGAYEIRVNDAVIASSSGDNTGASDIADIKFGQSVTAAGGNGILYFDDIALNDTTGTVNNSWCGAGTIVGLKPKAAGNKSQWTTSQGWALGENGTTTTNVEITGHGLSDNDVIYNATRDAYRIVTVVDANNLTVTSLASQAENDIFVLFAYAATIAAGAGTDTYKTVLAGHTLESYDVTVNTSRSNAIRRVIYLNGTSVYNSYSGNTDYAGSTVGSQTNGDSIKTFKVLPYAIADHYKAVYSTNPNPQYSNIQSGTSGHIDTFDMEELVADKSIPANAGIIAAMIGISAKEKGAGSQIIPILRISGADYDGDTISLNSGTLEYQQVYNLSPGTGVAWDIAGIDALEAGVKVV